MEELIGEGVGEEMGGDFVGRCSAYPWRSTVALQGRWRVSEFLSAEQENCASGEVAKGDFLGDTRKP